MWIELLCSSVPLSYLLHISPSAATMEVKHTGPGSICRYIIIQSYQGWVAQVLNKVVHARFDYPQDSPNKWLSGRFIQWVVPTDDLTAILSSMPVLSLTTELKTADTIIHHQFFLAFQHHQLTTQLRRTFLERTLHLFKYSTFSVCAQVWLLYCGTLTRRQTLPCNAINKKKHLTTSGNGDIYEWQWKPLASDT